MSRLARAGVGLAALLALVWVVPAASHAEDGYDLWLRYPHLPESLAAAYRHSARSIVMSARSPTLDIAREELARGLGGLLGAAPSITAEPADGSIVLGTPKTSALIGSLPLGLERAGPEGYLLRALSDHGHRLIVIAANSDIGVLYGTFHLLRLLQTQQPLGALDVLSAPRLRSRLLDHWDNLDRSVERGYAGESIWDWHKLPDYLDRRYVDYARACASIGINGTVPNNVGADAIALTHLYLVKLAALANLLRPYGLRVYLSARFSAPIELGGLATADPLDPRVRAWWRAKAQEIYALIPDFGGFLVKASSEGQPGPSDYGRTLADGANALADAVAPEGGIVMWRGFIYSPAAGSDRARQAYDEIAPLDRRLHENVLLQVKNGPIDFQPREPFHPLFGAMPHTPLMMEFQITKEYLGFATHLVYLGTLYEETLRSDTYARGPGSTVAKVVEGALSETSRSGMAGVANIGSDRNWTGSHFDQANWYAFGRLAWNPEASARSIAEEWLRTTFTNDPTFVRPVLQMMMRSREAAVDYMTPLGLHHQMAKDSHYGPGPWVSDAPRADWNSTYYSRADPDGIGFDRTAHGSNALAQYAAPLQAPFSDPHRIPESLLLWFHHVPWDFPMHSGRTLWQELVVHYSRGVQTVREMRRTWAGLAGRIDTQRYEDVGRFLAIQENEARWWRDASIAYFQSLSHRPLPPGYPPPEHSLAYYESLCIPYAPGTSHQGERLCIPKEHGPAAGEPAQGAPAQGVGMR